MSLSSRIAQAQRQDGYTNDTAKVVCAFQAWAEKQPNCDYAKLRIVLSSAKGAHCTVDTLIAAYNSK